MQTLSNAVNKALSQPKQSLQERQRYEASQNTALMHSPRERKRNGDVTHDVTHDVTRDVTRDVTDNPQDKSAIVKELTSY